MVSTIEPNHCANSQLLPPAPNTRTSRERMATDDRANAGMKRLRTNGLIPFGSMPLSAVARRKRQLGYLRMRSQFLALSVAIQPVYGVEVSVINLTRFHNSAKANGSCQEADSAATRKLAIANPVFCTGLAIEKSMARSIYLKLLSFWN